jgi:hypothetical protein
VALFKLLKYMYLGASAVYTLLIVAGAAGDWTLEQLAANSSETLARRELMNVLNLWKNSGEGALEPG